jgi:hypothetical protein
MKILLMMFAALFSGLILLLAGVQVARVMMIELGKFVSEAWHLPESHSAQ